MKTTETPSITTLLHMQKELTRQIRLQRVTLSYAMLDNDETLAASINTAMIDNKERLDKVEAELDEIAAEEKLIYQEEPANHE